MTLCMDCGQVEAEFIIYDKQKGEWFKLCNDCISSEDMVCPFSIQNIAEKYYE